MSPLPTTENVLAYLPEGTHRQDAVLRSPYFLFNDDGIKRESGEGGTQLDDGDEREGYDGKSTGRLAAHVFLFWVGF